MEFYIHNITDEDIKEIVSTLKTPFLTTGPVTETFEKKLANYLKVKHCVGVTSCTAALHLSLLAYDIGPGDEVITTPMTFVATANAILHCGATPVFADIDPATGNIDPEEIAKKITSKTKAIIPVHLYGVLCDMKKIYKLAQKHNLKVISDCAHTLEGKREEYNSAEYCDAACYSFYATKNLASGEGGAIAVNDTEIAEKLKILRLHGMTKSAIDRYSGSYRHYDVEICGWKYNMDDLHASLLVNQINRLDYYRQERHELYNKYVDLIKDINSLEIPYIPETCQSAYHLFVIRLKNYDKRDYCIEQLQKKGIPVAVNFNPVHLMKYYREKFGYEKGNYPEAEKFGSSIITLPFYVKLSDENLQIISESLHDLFKNNN